MDLWLIYLHIQSRGGEAYPLALQLGEGTWQLVESSLSSAGQGGGR